MGIAEVWIISKQQTNAFQRENASTEVPPVSLASLPSVLIKAKWVNADALQYGLMILFSVLWTNLSPWQWGVRM